MSDTVTAVLTGAVAMASFVAMLFFLRFWRQTRDRFFLLFAVAFGLDALFRLTLGLSHPSAEAEPLFYIARLAMFGLILAAIILKNRPGKPSR
jgi:uncharacterized membrane protein HdeD (DUF308 family)